MSVVFSGGDITPKNVWLAESVLDILSEYRLVLSFIL